jgi:hypothetical protein
MLCDLKKAISKKKGNLLNFLGNCRKSEIKGGAMQATMTDTYEGSKEIRCLTPSCGKGGLYKDFKNLRLDWDPDGQMYLKADCPNSDCLEGQIVFEERVDIDDFREGYKICPDCEGEGWVMLDLEIIISEDRGDRSGNELYESVKGDIGL